MPRRVAAAVLLSCLLAALPAHAATDRDCLRTARGVDLQAATIDDLRTALAAGALTSTDLVDAYTARIAAFDRDGSKLNSVRDVNPHARADAAALDAERAQGHIRGPLHGIPILLKDNVGTAGEPTAAGSIALKDNVPPADATLTARLRAAGAVILGKTNLSEFANWMATGMPNGYSTLGGQVHNAYDGGDPSGSSAGSGVAGSMALAAATIGTETSGSILSPSLANSLVGLKPTLGLVSRHGVIPLSPQFDTPGPMARNVSDAAHLLDAIAGPDPDDPITAASAGKVPPAGYAAALRPDALKGVKLAYSTSDTPGGAAGELWDRTLKHLEDLGATLVPGDGVDAAIVGSLGETAIIYGDFHWSLDDYLSHLTAPGFPIRSLAQVIVENTNHPDELKYGQDKLIASEAAPGADALAVAQAAPAKSAAAAIIDTALGGADAFIAPDSATIGAAAVAGYPDMVLPLGYPDGERMGIAFLGARWSEARLLSYAYALEQATHARRAPTTFAGGARPGDCRAASQPPFDGPRRAAAAVSRREAKAHRRARTARRALRKRR